MSTNTDETKSCVHSEPDYYGQCEKCGLRLVTPSQALIDHAAAMGGMIAVANYVYRRMPDGSLERVELPTSDPATAEEEAT